ncbi:MAG: ribonuclease HII [bacterium]|nr:ribonuclease HII [bacterium]
MASSFSREIQLRQSGVRLIAGVDEAGRGPLAGPVAAAAVIPPPDAPPELFAGVRDSKQLSESAREQLYQRITQNALAWAVVEVSAREIDELNIRRASLLAMKRAVERLDPSPEYVLVDGRDYPDLALAGEAVIKGDASCLSIGAASIIAKVTRDRHLCELHKRYPDYGFDQHKGYPTKYHDAALQLFGACAEHRTTYKPVAERLLAPDVPPALTAFLKALTACGRPEDGEALRARLRDERFSELECYYLEQRLAAHLAALAPDERRAPSRRRIGENWEHAAARLLEEKGYAVMERNFRVRGGEIDLIVSKGTMIVFVEVKARRSRKFGSPLEAITETKRKRLIAAAERYLYDRGLHEGWDVRYDVVSILALKGQSPEIEHIEDAFRVDESF